MPSIFSKNIKISEIQRLQLFNLVRFVYEENSKRHNSQSFESDNFLQIISLYTEDLRLFPFSKYYAMHNHENEIIGSVKVTKWDKLEILPIQSDFNINLLNTPLATSDTNFWHVGRLAIKANKINSMKLLKTLMVYAINPICMDTNSIMIAECDKKLMVTLRSLGIPVKALGQSKSYLFSETFPIFCYRHDLLSFFQKHKYLLKQEAFNLPKVDYFHKKMEQSIFEPQYL